MRMLQVVISIVELAFVGASVAFSQGDTEFSYQGRLLDAGAPANGTFNVDFRLWDDPTAGNQVGSTITFNNLAILEGLFTVELDFGASVFDNTDRWLEITVDGVPLAPRQPITRAPYAIQTRGIFVDENGLVGIGTGDPLSTLHVESDEATSAAIYGFGTNYGGRFESAGMFGRGVYGEALSSTGTTFGGRFFNRSNSGGAGVQGLALAATGFNYGGWFESESTSGRGVLGRANASTGTTYGGRFESASTSGFAGYFEGNGNDAVYVENTGDGRGLHAVAPSDTAIWGQTTTGFAGVHGQNASTTGLAVYGQATATTGTNYGVYGASNSASGYDFYAGGAGVNYGASSSRRWKHNVKLISEPLEKLGQLRGVYFDWDDDHGGAHDVGMIAEEVGAVLPEVVQFEENGTDASGMDYSKMTPLLVEAVNALRIEKNAEIRVKDAEIAAQAMRLTKLERQNADLSDANAALQNRLDSLQRLVDQLASIVMEQPE